MDCFAAMGPTIPTMETTPPQSDRSLRSAIELLKVFRSIDPEMTIGAARCFLLIAAEEDLSVADLQKKGGMALSTASRHHRYLGTGEDRHHKPGKGLVVALPSAEDSRRKALRLTPRGEVLLARVTASVNGGK
jgi:DNA-binding MarR family transcriptional regulator